MNASKLARWAALPAAAIVATTAGTALAEDPGSHPATEQTATEETAEETPETMPPEEQQSDVAAEVRAFLQTDEGRALLAEVAGDPEALHAEIAELKLTVADLQEQVRMLADLVDARGEAPAETDEDEAETGTADDQKRGWQEKQEGESRGWHGEKDRDQDRGDDVRNDREREMDRDRHERDDD